MATKIANEKLNIPKLGGQLPVPLILLRVIQLAATKNVAAAKWLLDFQRRIGAEPAPEAPSLVVPEQLTEDEIKIMFDRFNRRLAEQDKS